MVESLGNFPFRNLRYRTFLTLNVMMCVKHKEVLEFMFNVNKEGRTFLKHKISIIQNEFVNNGLIPY